MTWNPSGWNIFMKHSTAVGSCQLSPTHLPTTLILFFCTTRLDLPAVGEQRLFEMPPNILDRMAMVGLKPGMRIDRFDRFGEALGVIREGSRHLEAEVFASLQTLPGILPIFRRRFMGDQDAVMLILDDHHPGIRAQRVVAINGTFRRRGERKQLPQH